jgi:uncharacterized membrane protein YiaA
MKILSWLLLIVAAIMIFIGVRSAIPAPILTGVGFTIIVLMLRKIKN